MTNAVLDVMNVESKKYSVRMVHAADFVHASREFPSVAAVGGSAEW
jgi:hypothetical protein